MNFLKLAVVSLFIVQAALAMPAQVILIRHGEKPDVGNELNAQGWRRARALPKLFTGDTPFTKFGSPVAIYAMAPKDEDGSLRPIQTVTPLSQQIGVPIRSQFKKKQISDMVNEIKITSAYDGKTVLICWEHKVIPIIAQAFDQDAPDSWGKSFDRAWVITFTDSGTVASFKDLPQNLLSGDSPN
jgi:hypothetical protein